VELDELHVAQATPRLGGEAHRVSDFKGGVSDIQWSPDSTRIAFVADDQDPADEPEKLEGWKRKTAPPIVIDRYQFKQDGDGYRLTGTKTWISNAPEADVYAVFARTGEAGPRGVTAFVVPRESEGLEGEPIELIGSTRSTDRRLRHASRRSADRPGLPDQNGKLILDRL
jgi:dipeptidyl aminopeptidase/acylaminoacyl peptidase